MSYSLLRDSKVVLFIYDRVYIFDALSNISFSQTFARKTSNRKTLHSKNSAPLALIGNKNTATLQLGVYCTDTIIEQVFLELAGLQHLSDTTYRYPDSISTIPLACELYVVNKTSSTRFKVAVLESLEISSSRNQATSFEVSFACADMVENVGLPIFDYESAHKQGSFVAPAPIHALLGINEVRSVINTGISIQQTIGWRDDRALHDIGTLYRPRLPILEETSMGVTLTSYKVGSGTSPYLTPYPEYTDLRMLFGGMDLSMSNVMSINRTDAGEVYTDSRDFTITELTDDVIIKLTG